MPQRRVIIADDANVCPPEIRSAMTGRGFDVVPLRSGAEVYQRIAVDRPQAVVVGFRMPDLNGLDLCRLVKDNLSLKQTPIVILNDRPEPTDRRRSFDAGCDGYFETPLDVAAVVSRVQELCGTPATTQQLSFTRFVVDYRSNTDLYSVFSADAARKTIFMRLRRTPDVGAMVHIRVTVAGTEVVDAYGEVIRTVRREQAQPGEEPGMEIRFVEIDDQTGRFIESLSHRASFASQGVDDVSLDVVVQRITSVIHTRAKGGLPDPILQKVKFTPDSLKQWETAAFEALHAGGQTGGDFSAIVRELVGLSYKLEYHLINYKVAPTWSEGQRVALTASSELHVKQAEQALGRAQVFADRAVREGRMNDVNAINTTRGALLQPLTVLRSHVGKKRAPTAAVAPVASDTSVGAVYSDKETSRLVVGIADLFDFQSASASRSYASFLNIDFDLAKLEPWEVTSFIEVKAQTKMLPVEFADWIRVLVAIERRIDAFLTTMRAKRHLTYEQQEEGTAFARDFIARIDRCEGGLRSTAAKLIVRGTLPAERVEQIAKTNKRLLETATQLAGFNDRLSPGTEPLAPRVGEMSAAAEAVFRPATADSLRPATFDRARFARAAGEAKEEGKKKGLVRWLWLKPRRAGESSRWAVLKRPRVVAMLLGIAACGILLLVMTATGPDRMVREDKVFSSVLAKDLPTNIPLLSFPRPVRFKDKLNVTVHDSWLSRDKAARTADVREFFEALTKKIPDLRRVGLFDSKGKLKGYAEQGRGAAAVN